MTLFPSRNQLVVLVVAALAIAGGSIGITYLMLHTKRAYVNNVVLFNEFKMKKLLEADYKKVENLRASQLDSMRVTLSLMYKNNNSGQYQQLISMQEEALQQKQEEFAEMNAQLSGKYNEQIWKQLNQYVQDYGKQEGYESILGSTSDGTLMYFEEHKDITQPLIQYVNKRFEGEKK